MKFKPLSQIRAIGQTYTLLRYQIILHLHNNWLLALKGKLISDLTTCKSATDYCHSLTNWSSCQIFAGLNHLLVTWYKLQHSRFRTCSYNYRTIFKFCNISYFCIEMNLNIHLFHLAYVPCQQITQLTLVALCTCSNKCTTKSITLLIDYRLMTAKLQHSGSFHTTNTTTDNHHSLRIISWIYVMLIPLHCLCIYSTSRQVETII